MPCERLATQKLMASSRRVWTGPRILRKLELVKRRRMRAKPQQRPVAGVQKTSRTFAKCGIECTTQLVELGIGLEYARVIMWQIGTRHCQDY